MRDNLRIIDFARIGNVVRFYFGDPSKDYYGDDWNDRPYDCNAGTVYDEFVEAWVDAAWPARFSVQEPCSLFYENCPYCKDDMKDKVTPCIIIDEQDEYGQSLGQKMPIFFGDDLQRVLDCHGIVIDQKEYDK